MTATNPTTAAATKMSPIPLTRTRKFTPIPRPPLQCPKCTFAQFPFENNPNKTQSHLKNRLFTAETDRDIHYFQDHILGIGDKKVRGELLMYDEGNYDGPLGKEKHVFHRSRFYAEPESYVSEGEEEEGDGKGYDVTVTLTEIFAQTQICDTVSVTLPIQKRGFEDYFKNHFTDHERDM
ncbi:hypothetical protein DL98DRAFT_601082 [Cadophora sp. DSE1049]|nr:hypothetical protein DL98DRAFT_601082 [Cadophora sp. DSE1049]